jgi:hypothetical protein
MRQYRNVRLFGENQEDLDAHMQRILEEREKEDKVSATAERARAEIEAYQE